MAKKKTATTKSSGGDTNATLLAFTAILFLFVGFLLGYLVFAS